MNVKKVLIATQKHFQKKTTTKEEIDMSNTKSSNQTAVPEAKGALDRFKFEVANELGVPLTDGYNGNLTSKQNGSVGGYMVKKIVSEQPLNFNSIFYIIPRVIVNYRTTFPGISLLIFLFHPLLKASLVAQSSLV